MYEEMIAFMRAALGPNDLESTKSSVTLFRRRSEHSLRVLGWAEILAEEHEDLDLEALKIAALFHDIGYASCTNKKEHAAESAKICDGYLKSIGYDETRTQRIVDIVAAHSQKALLREADTPIELKVLMEADLLDETGALGVLWDCLVQGQKPEQSYAATYQHIVDFTAQSLKTNPMVSTKGKRIWEQKRRLVEAFLESLEQDLFVGNQLWGVPRGR